MKQLFQETLIALFFVDSAYSLHLSNIYVYAQTYLALS